jgi:hypothetical protein
MSTGIAISRFAPDRRLVSILLLTTFLASFGNAYENFQQLQRSLVSSNPDSLSDRILNRHGRVRCGRMVEPNCPVGMHRRLDDLGGNRDGAVAAMPGLVDYFFLPPQSSAKRRATIHMALNLSAVGLFAVGWLFRRDGIELRPSLILVLLEVAGFGLLMVGGAVLGESEFPRAGTSLCPRGQMARAASRRSTR